MKKKHRTITVDGQEYCWIVNGYDWDSRETWVSIYKNKKFIKSFRSDESSITPKMVESAIRTLK
jgi:hypothetical protein